MGPLAGVRVIELAGIGPGPFAGMMLADMGADVVRVDRAADVRPHPPGPYPDVLLRGRRSIGVDLKHPAGRQVVLDLARGAHALIEGFRPGVTERLGLGPADCHAVNPALVYGRMTGWGQDGPLAATAGHDLGYIARTGALHAARRAGGLPVPPVNLLGDFGGGGMFLAFGVVSALLEARGTGRGRVVDAAIVDGTAALTNFLHGLRALGQWPGEPGHNVLDTGAPFYDVYACADGRELAVGALEQKFYAELLRLSGVAWADGDELSPARRLDPATWPAARRRWAAHWRTRTRDDWTAVFTGSDACVAPVLDWDEAAADEHLVARGTYVRRDGVLQAAPAPRFSAPPAAPDHPAAPDRPPAAPDQPPADAPAAGWERPPPHPGEHTDEILADLGRGDDTAALRTDGAVA